MEMIGCNCGSTSKTAAFSSVARSHYALQSLSALTCACRMSATESGALEFVDEDARKFDVATTVVALSTN